MAVIDSGSSSAGKANVDSNFNLQTNLPTTMTQAGFAAVTARVDDGTITGTPKYNRAYFTENGAQRVGQGTLLWDDTFNATILNTSKYKFFSTTQTGAQAGGFLTLNNSGITTINTNSAITSTRSFPIFGNSETRIVFSGGFATATQPVSNGVTEFGMFSATLPGGAIPLDGAFFRFNNAAELRGVINFAGTETQTAAITPPATNVNHDWMIVIQSNTISWWIDYVLVASLKLTTDAPTQGQPFEAATQPITIRHYIGGSAPATACKPQFSDVFVSVLGPNTSKLWPHVKNGMGHMAYQTQNGTAPGSTALFSNNLASGAGVALTNTTAAAGVGLGGQFSVQPTLAVGTDGILCSYQNPVGSVAITPRTLYVTQIQIQGAVSTTALTGGPVLYAYSAAFGHTAVSMATAETASFTSGGVKAPRRISVGWETYPATAAVGTLGSSGSGIVIAFESPIVVAPGEFFAICAKNLGVVTSAGVITVLVTIGGYFE